MLNSVYDYDPKSRKDHLVEVASRVLDIVVPAVRPDVAIVVGALPASEQLISYPCLFIWTIDHPSFEAPVVVSWDGI